MRKSDHPEPQTIDMLRKLGYESSDVSLGVLVKWIAFLFVFIGGTSLLTLVIYWVFVPSQKVDQSSAKTAGKLPPGVPALQTHPKFDMKKFRQEQDLAFTSNGWVDKGKGIAHVNVDDKLAEIAASGTLPKAEPGAGFIPPARGEDIRGVAPNTAAPGGGASQGPSGETTVPSMPNSTTPGAQVDGPGGPSPTANPGGATNPQPGGPRRP